MAPLRRLAVVAVGWALLLGVTHASPYAVNPPRDLAASLLRSRDFDPQDCRQRMPSNPWDSCQDFLDRYKLTLPRFYHMNPEVETDCYNFIAGEEFCIASGQSTTHPPPPPMPEKKTPKFADDHVSLQTCHLHQRQLRVGQRRGNDLRGVDIRRVLRCQRTVRVACLSFRQGARC